ncbi:MAG: hypothetical protein ACLQDL_06605 [Spirochaetia bacterium]
MSDLDVRIAVFAWLRDMGAANGGILEGKTLNEGFTYQGRRVTLKGAAGIWFPQGFSIPLSITTALNGPYRLDDIADDGLLTYAYRGTDPNHRDNRGLREACRTRTPVIYLPVGEVGTPLVKHPRGELGHGKCGLLLLLQVLRQPNLRSSP